MRAVAREVEQGAVRRHEARVRRTAPSMRHDGRRQGGEGEACPAARGRIANQRVVGVADVETARGDVGGIGEGVARVHVSAGLAASAAGTAHEVHVRREGVLDDVAFLDTVLEVIAVANHVVRHRARDAQAVRTVHHHAAIIGAVNGNVTNVRTAAAVSHQVKVYRIASDDVRLTDASELDTTYPRGCGPSVDEDVRAEAREEGVLAWHRVVGSNSTNAGVTCSWLCVGWL